MAGLEGSHSVSFINDLFFSFASSVKEDELRGETRKKSTKGLLKDIPRNPLFQVSGKERPNIFVNNCGFYKVYPLLVSFSSLFYNDYVTEILNT